MGPRVALTDITDGLGRLGIVRGDLILVHASLSSLGHVEGGPDTLIDALLAAVGEGGTLALPGFTFQLNDIEKPLFDVRNTPCWASKVYERFRTREGTVRSHHISHAVCATGARAAELVSEHSRHPFLRPGPLGKIVDWGGKIVLMGVDHNCNTTFHLVEETEGLFYTGTATTPGAEIIDEAGQRRPFDVLRHSATRAYDFNGMDERLAAEGIQRETVIGNAIVRCMDARRMYDYAVAAVRADPETLLKQGETRVAIRTQASE